MGFQFLPKSVTLDDPERRNGRVVCDTLPNSVAFAANYQVRRSG